jgi:mycofactocin precursor
MYVEDKSMTGNEKEEKQDCSSKSEDPMMMEEYDIEELSVDGICGVY